MEDMPDTQFPVNFDLGEDETRVDNAIIRVIGVGGGGGNAVNYMLDSSLGGVEFIVANTDRKALSNLKVSSQIYLGQNITHGLGAGSDPDKGQKAAVADKETIQELLDGSDMVFITAGMGGGTGTGAAPVVAEVAKGIGALVVAVVTRPFIVEGKRRMKVAEAGIDALSQYVDALIVVPNQKLLQTQKQLTMRDAFAQSNTVLLNSVRGISELITKPGLIGTDFADVRTVMAGMGPCVVVCGEAKSSPSAARDACMGAINNPLLEDANLKGAQGVLVNITGGENLSMNDFEEVGAIVDEFADEDALIKIGTAIDESMDDGIKVTIVATGIEYSEPIGSRDVIAESANSNRDQATRTRMDRGLRSSSATWSEPRSEAKTRYTKRVGNEQAQSYPKSAAIDIPTFLRNRQLD